MKTISNDDLKEILRKHALWLNNDPEGEKADLSGADLSGADLRGVYLYKADLSGAGLRWADLWGADLSEADLSKADLTGADLSEAKIDWPLVCPEKGSFIGYKKCRGGLIVELEIPDDALRSSATTRKCRCSKAKVLSITNLDWSAADVSIASSTHDVAFVYKVGETVEVLNFNTDRWDECSAGIHFFITRQEAVDYA